MKFGAWHPFGEAETAAPDLPGLLQTRADVLLSYPRGRSAMVLYAGCRSSQTLQKYLHDALTDAGAPLLRRAHELGARWIRFGDASAPEHELERLTRQFQDRFGAPPIGNAELPPSPPIIRGARTPNG